MTAWSRVYGVPTKGVGLVACTITRDKENVCVTVTDKGEVVRKDRITISVSRELNETDFAIADSLLRNYLDEKRNKESAEEVIRTKSTTVFRGGKYGKDEVIVVYSLNGSGVHCWKVIEPWMRGCEQPSLWNYDRSVSEEHAKKVLRERAGL